MIRLQNKIIYLNSILLLLLFLSCSEEVNVIPDNEPFGSFNISDIKIENYVNRLYIDIIGREPLNEELEAEVEILKESDLNRSVREDIIVKLMTDTIFRPDEFSYKAAYAQNLYNLAKDRCLESLSDGDFTSEISNLSFGALKDSLDGDWDGYYAKLESIRKLQVLLDSRQALKDGLIEYHQMFGPMVNNVFYDIINMNTFNFVRATYDQFLWRLPTEQEFEKAFNMIEFNTSEELFGSLGADKNDYINIIVESNGMLEGMVTWAFQSYLNREPTPQELVPILQEYMTTKSINTVITQILVTDEYANFR
jgi:hypothetical protein